jgi:peptide/nickel transport system substrate-binding protein
MNVTVPPLDQKEVRQALNYAIDRQRFIDTTLANLVPSRVTLPWPTSSPAFDAERNKRYEYDLDKARSLLQSAGVSSFNTEFNYANSGPVQEFAQFAQIYQADLAQLGVNMTIKPMDGATWTSTAVKGAYAGLAIGQGGGFGGQDPTSGLATGEYGAANPFTAFQSDTYAQLVKDASAEIDPAKRQDLYTKINDLILDECFTMAICSLLQTSISTAGVHGLRHTTIGGFLGLTDAWME